MTLDEALLVLLDVHCRENWRDMPFTVLMGATPAFWVNQARYVEAWRTIREHRLRLESR